MTKPTDEMLWISYLREIYQGLQEEGLVGISDDKGICSICDAVDYVVRNRPEGNEIPDKETLRNLMLNFEIELIYSRSIRKAYDEKRKAEIGDIEEPWAEVLRTGEPRKEVQEKASRL